MNTVRIYRGPELIHAARVGETPLEIGSSPGCDLCVHDPEVAPRHWLVRARAGTVVAHELDAGPDRELALPPSREVPLGRHHHLVRVTSRGARVLPLARRASVGPPSSAARLSLVVGEGSEARRVAVGSRPMRVGSAEGCELRLHDASVGPHHCRLEPSEAGLMVRDLDGPGGTHVDGVRVRHAHLGPGARIRVGNTTLRVLDRAARPASGGPIAVSAAMQQTLAEVSRFASLPWPVLLLGESGSGKEVLARDLHERSGRAGPFVAVNAGGLPRELAESELFGHERGAFTGATAAHRGAFEQAQKGTLFVDEIGELPSLLQTRLLRVLETWHVRRLGAERELPVDVRLVCATHRDLRSLMQVGSFREDLYHRLARLVVEIPALRARPEDIPALAEHFLRDIERHLGPRRLSEGALSVLCSHAWAGNARELNNVLCAAAALSSAMTLETQDIQRALRRLHGDRPSRLSDQSVLRAYNEHGKNVSAAARALGIARSTVRARVHSALAGS